MNRLDHIDDPQRRLLVQALALGLFAGALPAGQALAQGLFGSLPAKLPPGRSIYRISGTAAINGAAATMETPIRPGDTVETGSNSQLIFVVGGHSMILRSETRLVLETAAKDVVSPLISAMRILTGKMLSVSRRTPMRVMTVTATVGIRGTGWYVEADPERTYFCTCYGTTEVTATNDPQSREKVEAKHHDRPLYILAKSAAGQSIRPAPFINHTDQELALIEALVGRTPPFIFQKDDYSGPRRDY